MRLPLFSLALLVAACGPAAPKRDMASAADASPSCLKRSSEKLGGPFHLSSQDGSPTTQDNFRGRKTFVFFGFTHCPDICPTTLYDLGQAIKLLPPNVAAPHTIFISVDPQRDTPEALAQYIKGNGFPKDITGLTGSFDELQQVSDGFVAPFSRDEEADTKADVTVGYSVTHSSILYLMDETWKLKTFFMQGESAREIAGCLVKLSG